LIVFNLKLLVHLFCARGTWC